MKKSIVTRISDSVLYWSVMSVLIMAYIAYAGWEQQPVYAAIACVCLVPCTDALIAAARKKGISID